MSAIRISGGLVKVIIILYVSKYLIKNRVAVALNYTSNIIIMLVQSLLNLMYSLLFIDYIIYCYFSSSLYPFLINGAASASMSAIAQAQ